MRRGLLTLLALLVIAWFEFQVYPGHSYLQGETQLLVPMLERLDTPGFLSRDLVASNPTFAYTIYDEITQSLHVGARLSFEQALLLQQILFRFAAVLGIFLLARALRVAPIASALISGSVNAITHLAAPEAFVTNPEATPASFALSLVFLASGLLVNRNPLLAGLAGGLALLYEPIIAAAFWLVVSAAWLSDRSLRKFLRPTLSAAIVFALILGNLVQLQAGLGVGQELTARISDAMAELTRLRTPWVWVSDWFWNGILTYAFLLVAGMWALVRLGAQLDRITKWMVAGLSVSGFISVAVAMLPMTAHSQFALQMTPARNLAVSVAISALLCGAASWQAAHHKRWAESLPWMAIQIALILNAQVLDLLRGEPDGVKRRDAASTVVALAQWADKNTWGSSLFQFPDAGRQNQPGIFRALSRRALWADWQSGLIIDYSSLAGQEWWSRWRASMATPYTPEVLQRTLTQPIDYYVLDRGHKLKSVKVTYENPQFVVYDAQDLRHASEFPKSTASGR